MALPKSGANSKPYDYSRFGFTLLLVGQIWLHLIQGRTYWRKISEHLFKTGPGSMIPVLLVNLLAGMIFTIQTARQLEKFGAMNSLGGAFAIAFCRELAPILTASVIAGQVGSAFAAELGAMKVTEQIDALYILRTHFTTGDRLLLYSADLDRVRLGVWNDGGNVCSISALSIVSSDIFGVGAKFISTDRFD
jgi:Permease MlaE